MKKNLLRFLFILLPLAAVTVSCDTNDDFSEADLVGIWDLIYREYVVEKDGVIYSEEKGDVEIGKSRFKLNEDGSYMYHDGSRWQDDKDTWTLSGSYLIINYACGQDKKILITEHYTNRMKLSYSYSEVSDGVTYNYIENTTHMRR